MKKRLGVIMDAPEEINYKKDSTLAMLWEASARDYELFYLPIGSLFLRDNVPRAHYYRMHVYQDPAHFYALEAEEEGALSDFDILLMRKDPPFNDRYIYATYILERAESLGVLVVNKPQALRDANEKIFATLFPEFSPPTLISSSIKLLNAFWQEHRDIVCKPLDAMGGKSIFRIKPDEVNAQVIFETLTQYEKTFITAQQFIPEIAAGDKRILFINGDVVPDVLVRVPQAGDWRGNLAVGAKGIIKPLTDRDRQIAAALSEPFKQRGLYFVGIDVIGNYLTEINVTSPTGIREIEQGSNFPVSKRLFDALERLM